MGDNIVCKVSEDTNFIIYLMGSIWDETCEDGAKFSEWQLDPKFMWVEFLAGDKKIGAFCIKAFNSTTLEFHIQILKEYRKQYAFKCAEALHKWLGDIGNVRPTFKKVIAFIPAYYQNVTKFADACGWRSTQPISNAYSKHGKLYDIIIYQQDLDELRK